MVYVDTRPTSKEMARVRGGDDESRLDTKGSGQIDLEIAVRGVWLSLSNTDNSTLKVRKFDLSDLSETNEHALWASSVTEPNLREWLPMT